MAGGAWSASASSMSASAITATCRPSGVESVEELATAIETGAVVYVESEDRDESLSSVKLILLFT